MTYRVEVEIRAPDEMPAFEDATVHVRVEDVSLTDAPARVVAERTLRGVGLRAGATLSTEVEVPAEAVAPRGDYAVRVLVESRGDGQVRSGDCVSAQRHPVLTFGRPSRVEVPLRRVP